MILVIDNYDSFTYNLVQYVGRTGAAITVRRNDQITPAEVAALAPRGIMLSPGPCTPGESGVCLPILRHALAAAPGDPFAVPLFGVCLGHEAIGQVAGSAVVTAKRIMHGKSSPVRHDGLGLFAGMPNPFAAIRYHSLVVQRDRTPDGFLVSATSADDDEIMGLRHQTRPIEGVQFHPESILTEQGFRIVENFVAQVYAPGQANAPARA
ncbi:MAG: aminodeoxychorismate/anthranilate synthase component II [Fimbriimonadaceae bacterium]|nr:aminodeoxychorismate/anthranilate synthase component II [Fimbriimonadaceae bacterium]